MQNGVMHVGLGATVSTLPSSELVGRPSYDQIQKNFASNSNHGLAQSACGSNKGDLVKVWMQMDGSMGFEEWPKWDCMIILPLPMMKSHQRSPRPPDFLSVWTHARCENTHISSQYTLKVQPWWPPDKKNIFYLKIWCHIPNQWSFTNPGNEATFGMRATWENGAESEIQRACAKDWRN